MNTQPIAQDANYRRTETRDRSLPVPPAAHADRSGPGAQRLGGSQEAPCGRRAEIGNGTPQMTGSCTNNTRDDNKWVQMTPAATPYNTGRFPVPLKISEPAA